MTAHDDSRFNSKTATVEELVSELELYTSEHFRTNQNSLDMTAQSTPPRLLTGKDPDSRFNSKTAHAVGKLGCNRTRRFTIQLKDRRICGIGVGARKMRNQHVRTTQNRWCWTCHARPSRKLTGKDGDSRFNSKTANAGGRLDCCT
ncbi:unnamed protein product [Polarella glacialis]|uniref:Uncharacterized protein n=1 Tax=Polarella glacialis TaxID=89957 RepID=A0A813G7F2_POLGL|nr:unnamed protein product [Polarella glacialis]